MSQIYNKKSNSDNFRMTNKHFSFFLTIFAHNILGIYMSEEFTTKPFITN